METPEQNLMKEVETELVRARNLFKPIHSPHEAVGVIREEYLEFEKEVWEFNLGKGRDTRPAMRKELIQLATMALRSILDVLAFDPTAEIAQGNITAFQRLSPLPCVTPLARLSNNFSYKEIYGRQIDSSDMAEQANNQRNSQ